MRSIGSYLDAGIKHISRRYRSPVFSVQGVADSSVAGGSSLCAHCSRYTCVWAIKRHEERDTLVIRLYNLHGEPVDDVLTFGQDVSGAWKTNLLEERVAQLTPTSESELKVYLTPH